MPSLSFTARRKLPRSSRILFAVAAALGLAAFLLVRAEVGRADQARRAAGPMAAVVVAAHDIAAGAAIGPADVRTTSIPQVYVPPEAVPSVEIAIGLVSAAPVRTGEVLVGTRLSASAFGALLAPGDVAVTVGAVSVPAGLTPADRVDAYATYAGARPYTTLVGEDLHVLAIGTAEASVTGPGRVGVTLDVDPETARQLLQAAASGTIGLAARANVTASPSPSPSAFPGATPAPG